MGKFVAIRNTTRDADIVTHGRRAASFWPRLRGLIGVRTLPPGAGLLIEPCQGVHCMFMSIPIDVVYVAADHRVIAVDLAMQPWAVGKIRRDSAYVVELPAGQAAQTGLAVGDRLEVRTLE